MLPTEQCFEGWKVKKPSSRPCRRSGKLIGSV